MHEDEIEVGDTIVRRLLRSQMPNLAELPLIAVEPWGTDNAIWRLGSDLVIRLPRIHWAAGQVELEARWLPRLAPNLPVAIPEPIAIGEPSADYPYRWAVHRWIPGEGRGAGPNGRPHDIRTRSRRRRSAAPSRIDHGCPACPEPRSTTRRVRRGNAVVDRQCKSFDRCCRRHQSVGSGLSSTSASGPSGLGAW